MFKNRSLIIIATFALLAFTGCNPSSSSKTDSIINSDSNVSANDIIMNMIKSNLDEIAELEREHDKGTISEKDYQLNKAIKERENEILLDKL